MPLFTCFYMKLCTVCFWFQVSGLKNGPGILDIEIGVTSFRIQRQYWHTYTQNKLTNPGMNMKNLGWKLFLFQDYVIFKELSYCHEK